MDLSNQDDQLHSLTALSDEEIVEKLKIRKDRSLQSELYDRYIERVYFKCLSVTNDSAMARDFAHDIFIKIFTNLHQFKGNSKLSLWIHSITYHHCIRQLQRLGKIVYNSEVESEETTSNSAEDLFNWEAQQDVLKSLELGMQRLAVEDRLLLLMKYQDAYSVEQISLQLGLNQSAVKMRLLRAREKLRVEISRILKDTRHE